MARRKKNQTEKGTKIVEDKKFQPYVPADKVMPEFTAVSILLGALLAIIFGGANAYLGLRVGMTVSASIPAAVISMGVIRKVLRRDSILENNMVQTIGSAGESVAAGAIFTLPALFMWAKEGLCDTPSMITIGLDAAGKELYLSDKINLSGVFSIGSIGGLVCFAGVLLTIYFFATKDSKKKSN